MRARAGGIQVLMKTSARPMRRQGSRSAAETEAKDLQGGPNGAEPDAPSTDLVL
jgi:hypothetical protein